MLRTSLRAIFAKSNKYCEVIATHIAPFVVYGVAVAHAVIHYYYLFTIIPIDKKADYFDLAVYPIGFSLFFLTIWWNDRKTALRWGVPVMFVTIALLVTAYFYYYYYDTVLNISLMWQLLHDIDRGAIKHVLAYTGSGMVWIVFLLLGSMVLTIYASFKMGKSKKISVWYIIAMFVLLWIQPLKTITDTKRPVAQKYRTAKMRIIVNAGLPYYLIYDLIQIRNVRYEIPTEYDLLPHRETRLVENAPIPYNPKYIFIIQIESLNASIISHTIHGKEVTPFLNDLTRKAYYFPYMFANHLLGSADADFSTLTSLLPQKNQLTYNYSLKHTPSLPRFLHEKNMQSYVFQSLRGSFFNYENAFKELGIDSYYGRDYFTEKGDGWDVRDVTFFMRSFDLIQDKINKGEQGLYHLISLQSHGPYRNHDYTLFSREEMKTIKSGIHSNGAHNETMLHYFNTIHETDEALRLLYEKITAQPWYKESLIIIFGDHAMEEGATELYDSRNGFPETLENIPLFVCIPGEKGHMISSPVAPIDIAPTIAYLTGHEPSKFWSGQNVFSVDVHNNEKSIILNNQNGVLITPDQIYFQNGNQYRFSDKKLMKKVNKIDANREIDRFIRYSHGWFYGFEK